MRCAVCCESDPRRFATWFTGEPVLFRCRTCGFVFQAASPHSNLAVTDYRNAYDLGFLDAGKEFKYPGRRAVLQDIVDRLAERCPAGDILDVGCGDGHFLYLAAKKGFRCFGVDDSESLSSFAASKSGAEVKLGLYGKEMFPAHTFDAISFIQVLEHIPEPELALEAAKYHLRPGGILIVEVPSITAPHFLGYRATGLRWFVRPPTGVITPHVGYYSPWSLSLLAKRCGFERLEITTGRWLFKYSGALRRIGQFLDPIFNLFGIGGILYFGRSISGASEP
jgi:SAM-dependent methyltransferase